MEDIKTVALRVAREMCNAGLGMMGHREAVEFASRLLAELQKDATPVAYLVDGCDWQELHFGKESAEQCEHEHNEDGDSCWIVPLGRIEDGLHPQPKAAEDPDADALHIAYMMGHAKGREQAQPKAATVPQGLVLTLVSKDGVPLAAYPRRTQAEVYASGLSTQRGVLIEEGRFVLSAPYLPAQSDPVQALLEVLGHTHPFALPPEEDTRGKRYERLRKAYCTQQPWPVPDQACIVWRADVMEMAGDLNHKQAFFDQEKRKREASIPAAEDARDGERLDFLSRPSIEIGDDSDEGEFHHVVYQVIGGRSDREWRELGRGATLRAAIDAAMSQDSKGEV